MGATLPSHPAGPRPLWRDLALTATVAGVAGALAGWAMRAPEPAAPAHHEAGVARRDPAPRPAARPRPDPRPGPAAAAAVSLAPADVASPLPEDPTGAPPGPFTRADRDAVLRAAVVEPYETESRDAVWAPGFEAELRGAFDAWSGETGLAGVALDAVECRASRCRAVLRYDDASTTDATNEALVTRTLFGNDCTLHSAGIDASALAPAQTLYFECGRS